MESIDAFIDRLPKAELHLHLVGSASVPTVLELARRHPDSTVPRSTPELAAFYEFRDFPHFSQVYGAVSSLVREPADVAELVLGAARDLAGQNARYAELTVTPYTFTSAGMPAADLSEALDIAARSAGRDHGVRMAYIFDIAGEYGGPAAMAEANTDRNSSAKRGRACSIPASPKPTSASGGQVSACSRVPNAAGPPYSPAMSKM